MENLTDLYTDYLINSPGGLTTAVSMSKMLNGQLSHDRITRFLAKGNFDSKYLWQQVKPMVQELSSSTEEIVVSFDDSIEEKYYSDTNFRFDYVVNDSWYSSGENRKLIKEGLPVNFVMAVKSNCKVALTLADKKANHYISIGSPQPGQQTVEIWLEALDFPLLLVKQVFKNEDDTVGELYLACSDLSLSYERITTIYKRRWGVEEHHKSVKSNVGFAKSPTHMVKTQTNHFMLSILAYAKLEWLKQRNQMNHFAMKAKIYQAALEAAYNELKILSTTQAA